MAEKRVSDIFNDVLLLVESKANNAQLYLLSLIPQTNADYIASMYLLMVAFTFLYGLWFMKVEYMFYNRRLKAQEKYLAERYKNYLPAAVPGMESNIGSNKQDGTLLVNQGPETLRHRAV